MKLNTLRLENLFCYQNAEINFQQGVSVFAGPNGSGKSSLMEGIFFALFGSQIKPITGREMSEVLREGESKGSVELSFELEQHHYQIKMALRRTGDRVSAEGKYCTLQRDNDESYSGVTAVTDQVRALLHMSAEDFANCLYVRQGEVDRLIKATPSQRQSDMDRLLRLDLLDRYERRLKDGSLRAFNRRKDRLDGKLDTIKRSMEALDEKDLATLKVNLERELSELDGQQKQLTKNQNEVSEKLNNIQQNLSQFEQAQQALQQINGKISHAEKEIGERAPKIESFRKELQESQSLAKSIKDSFEQTQRDELWNTLQLDEAASLSSLSQQLEQERLELDQRLQHKRDEMTQIKADKRNAEAQLAQLAVSQNEKNSELESVQQSLLESEQPIRESLQTLGIDVGDKLSSISFDQLKQSQSELIEQTRESLNNLKADKAKIETEIDSAAQQIKQILALIDAGQCPTCQQTITQDTVSDHTQHLEKHQKEFLSQKIDVDQQIESSSTTLNQHLEQQKLLENVEAQFAQWQSQSQLLKQQQTAHSDASEAQKTLQESLDELCKREEITLSEGGELKAKYEQLKAQAEFVQKVSKLQENLTIFEDKANTQRQALQESQQNLDRHKEDLVSFEEYKKSLQGNLGGHDVPALQSQSDELQQQRNTLTAQQENLNQQRDTRQQSLGRLEEELNRQKTLQEDEKAVVEQIKKLDKLLNEIDTLRSLYNEVKFQQRQKNLNALNSMFNHFFKLMDSGATYDRVQLDEQFDIRMVLNDGTLLSPMLLSGGERALVNLALRAAMHRVICEAGGTLLPLFFDEPTVFLDEDRIHRLERLFEELGQQVGQVIVVSHEASLVESADHEYRVGKDGDNIGNVQKVR
jgi:exonuclease SbcC